MQAVAEPTPLELEERKLVLEEELLLAAEDPCFFLGFVKMVDEQTGSEFRFHMEPDGSNWEWQRGVVEQIHANARSIWLKARQLGLTWTAAAYGNLWLPLYRPGALTIIYRQTEGEAGEILERVWDMYQSLPEHLRNGAKVIAPTRGARPSSTIEWEFPDGRISRVVAMASTSRATRGKTVAFALLDEFAYIERADEIMKAVQPAVGSLGKIAIVSTANGRANLETGEGNYFYYLWSKAAETGFYREFLPWSKRPGRDQVWYDTSPEVQGLRPHERAAEYPSTPAEAFTLTNRVFFDPEALTFYAEHRVRTPVLRGQFESQDPKHAAFVERGDGYIDVFERPVEGAKYALYADISTGTGEDYSAATVVDLATMAFVAEFHARLGADLVAAQLHYLGRWYNTAWLAIERGGGYGIAVQDALRDGRAGRPPYPSLYRHQVEDQVDMPLRKAFGFPINQATRPKLVNAIEKAVRDLLLPYLSEPLLLEMGDFVEDPKLHPSPAARRGAHDDRVMAAAGALELYRQRGHHPDRHRAAKQHEYLPARPWEGEAEQKAKVRTRFKLDGGTVDRDGAPVKRRNRPRKRRRRTLISRDDD